MALHNTLTGSELHEPKGADTAPTGQIYVSDGAGSGTWKYPPSGFVRYKGSSAEQSFNTTPTKLLIDGLNTAVESYLPREIRGSGSLYNTVTNKIEPISEGDAYILRLDLPITSRSAANYGSLILDIGGDTTPTIPILERRFETGRSAPFNISLSINFDSLNTFKTNGGQLFINTDTGSIGVTGAGIQLTRIHGEV